MKINILYMFVFWNGNHIYICSSMLFNIEGNNLIVFGVTVCNGNMNGNRGISNLIIK